MVNKQKQKGFTLVELIVVLVILGVLAALLVPALTGYIEKSRKNAVIADTRAIVQATQTELSMVYATDEFQSKKSSAAFTVASKNNTPFMQGTTYDAVLKGADARYNDIVNLSEVASLKGDKGGRFFVLADDSGVVQFAAYDSGKNYYGAYCADTGTIEALTYGEVDHFGASDWENKVFVHRVPDFAEDLSKKEQFYLYCLGISPTS